LAPEPVWALWRRDKSFTAAENQTTIGCSVRDLVTIPIKLLYSFDSPSDACIYINVV